MKTLHRIMVALAMLTAAAPAQAHHVMGGKTPETFMQGLLSGLGHPVIGIDHLAFIVAMGVAVGAAGFHLALPALFIAASAIGVAVHVSGATLPAAEFVVALSVLTVGVGLASTRKLSGSIWAVLFLFAGVFHGYAFGESIFGAERTPLAAYLLGLVVVQGALATAVAYLVRRSADAPLQSRLAGAAVAGIGLAVLAGQLVPA